MNAHEYHENTTWEYTFGSQATQLIEELDVQLQCATSPLVWKSLSEPTRGKVEVSTAWVKLGMVGELAHGPLLGWAKIRGHELFKERHGTHEFINVRIPGLTWEEYPFHHHVLEVCAVIKRMLMQSRIWQGISQPSPTAAHLPADSVAVRNRQLLANEFGPSMVDRIIGESVSSESTAPSGNGFGVLQQTPAGLSLMIRDPAVLALCPMTWHRGGPPDGAESLFNRESPGATWLLQGKAQWCWVLRKKAGGDLSMAWLRTPTRASDAGSAFVVDQVMDVANGVHAAGLANFNYHHCICIEEGDIRRVVYMHLREAPNFVNQVDVFTLSKVSEAMQLSLASLAPAEADFVPRKGRAGWVLTGPLQWDRHCAASAKGWVWQEAVNLRYMQKCNQKYKSFLA